MPANSHNINPKAMHILFIARTYPPLVGGMERFASDFFRYMRELAQVKLIANPKGKRNIIFFFFKVMGYLLLHAREFEFIHFNDAILAPLLPIIRLVSRARVTFTVHGLDIVYSKFGYQHLVIPFLRHADQIFPVSQHTKTQCLSRNIPENKLQVIPNGLDFSTVPPCNEEVRQRLFSTIEFNPQGKTILLSLGRLIPRKGHAWFIENVFTNLPKEYLYLIAGNGPEWEHLNQLIRNRHLEHRVFLLGYVSDPEKACLYQGADLFIMPNIQDQNDQEGFGIVLLEAGSYGLPSVAADIEGIRDAVIDGVSGVLVPEKNAQGFINAITNPIPAGSRITQSLQKKYDWQAISQHYYQALRSLDEKDRP